MPPQKPGRSKQDYSTPDEFMLAVDQRFGGVDWDLAASKDNAKAEFFYTEEDNSLTKDWDALGGNLWLNPPFEDIETWARKCAQSTQARIFLLVPASIGSNWFMNWVLPHANVLALNPRLTFKGCKAPYPKDLMLCVYSSGLTGFDVWRWKP